MIGYGVAEASVEHGAIVYITSSNQDRINAAVAKLQAAYPSKKANIKGYVCDLGSEDLENNFARLFEEIGDVEHVTWSAADNLAVMSIQNMTLDKVRKAGQLRYFGPLLLAKYLPRTVESFTITSAVVATVPRKDWAIVSGYAAAMQGMARNLAVDLAPIRVNCVSLGLVDTELWKDMSNEAREQMYKDTAGFVVTGRVGKISDVAEGYLAFMKDENVTGAVYLTDGGRALL